MVHCVGAGVKFSKESVRKVCKRNFRNKYLFWPSQPRLTYFWRFCLWFRRCPVRHQVPSLVSGYEDSKRKSMTVWIRHLYCDSYKPLLDRFNKWMDFSSMLSISWILENCHHYTINLYGLWKSLQRGNLDPVRRMTKISPDSSWTPKTYIPIWRCFHCFVFVAKLCRM